jgi:hypothetical protein
MKSLDIVNASINQLKIGMFGGKASASMPALFNFIFGIKKDTPNDVGDWNEIRLRANELAQLFKK